VSPRLRPVGNEPAVTVYCTVPNEVVATNETVLIAVPAVHDPILERFAGLDQVVTGVTVNVNERVTALPPLLDTALTVIGEVPAEVGVPVMVPAEPLNVSPVGRVPAVML
jgi:hypothetical protein